MKKESANIMDYGSGCRLCQAFFFTHSWLRRGVSSLK
jgi:hypothetical protein